jgi:hypothetical protein
LWLFQSQLFKEQHLSLSSRCPAEHLEQPGFYDKYQERFIVPTFDRLLSNIKKSRILDEDEDGYRFGYNYILYYLSAKKISELLHSDEGKLVIKKLFAKVHIERNAFILVFVAHHSKDVGYIEQSIFNSMLVLENNVPITLNKDDAFYNSLEDFSKELVTTVLETNRNPRDHRASELEQSDREGFGKPDDNSKIGSNDLAAITIPFQQAFRSIEIVGQIIRNRKGSLEKPQLLQMIKEVYTAGFRTIGYLIEYLEGSKDAIIDFIVQETESTHSRFEIEQKINRFIHQNNLHVCLGVFIKIMHSVGTKELKSIYIEVANTVNTPASKLVSFSINSYFGTINEKELISLASEFKDNLVALNILRARVKSYVYNRELDFKTKQKFADILNMSLEVSKIFNQRAIS